MRLLMSSMTNMSSHGSVLLVDDEPDIATVFRMALEDDGFIVDIFNDSLLALSNFKTDFYGLMILDINMPKMNGVELYREIRKIDDKVKVCFLTASEIYHEELMMSVRALDQSVECFIPKPVTIDELVNRVREELNKINK
jgi:two-component system, OmpR family, response regulator ChvI